MSPSRGLPKILPWLLFAAIAPTHLFWKGSLSSQAFCPLNSLAIGRRRTKPPDVYVVPLSRGGLPLFQQQQTPKERRDDTNQWQPGNMERDFDRLEQAIAFTNADQNLQHQERIETLNYIAQQRRPISPDLAMYVLSPLMASFALAIIFNHIDDSHGLGRQFLVKGAQYVSILHFWSMVILVPVFFLLVKQGMDRRRVGDSEADDGNLKLPSELQGLDSEYLRFVTLGSQQLDGNLPPSTTSTRDHVQCLLEQWTSAILGVAIFAPCWCKSSHGSLLWLVQCTTRLGVLASLRQYHGLWFALIRRKQPRPLPFQVVAMQSLTRLQFAPWFTALDLALLCVMPWPRLPWSTVCQFYGSAIVCTGLATMATRKPNRLAKYKENVVTRQIQKLRPPPIDLMVRAAGIGWLWKHRLSTLEYCQLSLDGLSKISFLEFCVYFPWFRFVKCMGISMALLGPLCHILAFRRLLRVRYTHGVSMAADMARFDQVENEDELISNTNSTCARSNKNGGWPPEQKGWRYWLTWREPKRIRVTLDQVFGGFWHWFLFSGSVEDKLRKEYRGKFQSEIKRRGLTVLQRVAEDQANLRSPAIADRSLWKQNAMIKIAEDHQNSYDLKSFDDPLGIAVQQTFGIGLGFNFDHMSELEESEEPSTRRLQSRAAKSAIRRAQQIYDAESARTELDTISDLNERNERAAMLRLQADKELKYLSNRLSELIPTDLALDQRRTSSVQQYQQYNPNSFSRTSENEYMISTRTDRSPALERLLNGHDNSKDGDSKRYEIDYLNPMGDNSDETDNEFVEKWSKRYKKTTDDAATDDEEEDSSDGLGRKILA